MQAKKIIIAITLVIILNVHAQFIKFNNGGLGPNELLLTSLNDNMIVTTNLFACVTTGVIIPDYCHMINIYNCSSLGCNRVQQFSSDDLISIYDANLAGYFTTDYTKSPGMTKYQPMAISNNFDLFVTSILFGNIFYYNCTQTCFLQQTIDPPDQYELDQQFYTGIAFNNNNNNDNNNTLIISDNNYVFFYQFTIQPTETYVYEEYDPEEDSYEYITTYYTPPPIWENIYSLNVSITAMAFSNNTLIIGDFFANNGRGIIKVFNCTNFPCILTQEISAPDLVPNGNFGQVVALFDKLLIVSANSAPYSENNQAGRVYVYNCTNFNCVFKQSISSSGYLSKLFGGALAIHETDIYIGDPWANYTEGVVYHYSCTSFPCNLIETITINDDIDSDQFGVYILYNNNILAISSNLTVTYAQWFS